MTAFLILVQAVLAAVLLAGHRLPEPTRERFVRGVGGIGVLSGLVILLLRSDLPVWRGFDLSPANAAVAGSAIACSWGLVTALDLGALRWWVGALSGVATCGLLSFAASAWTIPSLLFLLCASAAVSVAAARASRPGWLSFAAADAALVAVLIADAVTRDAWDSPEAIPGVLLVPLLASVALRTGLVMRTGPLSMLGQPASVMAPVVAAVGLITLSRWVERPLPIPAALVLCLGLAVSVWSILHRRIEPAVVGVWPVALGCSLMLASDRATVPASVSILLGLTMINLWPHALERGRLSRGFLLSGMAPTIAFGAIGLAARESFIGATEGGDPLEVGAWIAMSALLPVAFATGVALGVSVARSEPTGDYHPEAVFMTWVVTLAAAVAGFMLGPGAIFGALGGSEAAVLFGVAALFGAIVAARVDVGEVAHVQPSSVVVMAPPIPLGTWAQALASCLYVGIAGAVTWITLEGLKVGFL